MPAIEHDDRLVRAGRLIERIRELGPELEAASRQAEVDRALPSAIVERLRELGLFWLKTPNELGGIELDPLEFCDVLEEVAYHDASAGWAVMVGNGTTGFLAGTLPDEGIADLFAPGAPLPILAGQFVPRGKAVAVDGGYRVTGRWSFCSGITHADWVVGGCTDESGDMRLVCVPKAEATVLDTWHAAGLQGTASHDFALADHVVPAHRTISMLGDGPKRGGPLFRQPVRIFVGNELGPVAIGIARRALDDMRAVASGTSRAFSQTSLGHRAAFHKAIGEADAKLTAARLLYRDTVALGWERSRAGTADDAVVAVTMARTTHAVQTCVELVGGLFRYGGGRVLSLDHPMQRHLRNLIAAGQHVYLTDENFELAGKALLAGVRCDRG
jgi:indole-3-acetate monooxygenase